MVSKVKSKQKQQKRKKEKTMKKSKVKTALKTSLARIEDFFKAHHRLMIPDGKDAFKVKNMIEGDTKLDFYFKDIPEQSSVLVTVKSDKVHPDNVHTELFHLVNHLNEAASPLKFTIDGSNGSLQLAWLYPNWEINSTDLPKLIAQMAVNYEQGEILVDNVAGGMSVVDALNEIPDENQEDGR